MYSGRLSLRYDMPALNVNQDTITLRIYMISSSFYALSSYSINIYLEDHGQVIHFAPDLSGDTIHIYYCILRDELLL